MSEIPANPIQNTAIPPIDAITTPPVINELPKKRNYLPWLLGILVLTVILAISFLILIGKSKSAPTGSLTKPFVSPEQTTATADDIDMLSWKTYTIPFGSLSLPLSKQDAALENKTLTFKYPTDWKIVDRENSNQSSNYAYDLDFYLVKSDPNEQVTCSSKDSPCSSEGVSPLSTQISLSLNAIPDMADVLSADYWSQLNVFSKKSETYINRAKVTQGFINENDDIPSDLIFDLDKDKLRVNIYGLNYASKETSEEIKQILSTFKFIDSQSKLPEVPVYPQAKFTKKEFIPSCPGEQAVCNVDSYTWEFSGNIDEVISWYEQDQSKSAWKLAGGAGLQGTDRYGNFSNGKVRYWLTIYLLGPEGPVGIELRGPLN